MDELLVVHVPLAASAGADALAVDGMSSARVRHLLSNLCATAAALGSRGGGGSGCAYLEVGTYKGSTLLATLLGNRVAAATAIDNFSEFNGPREALHANLAALLPPAQRAQLDFMDADAFGVDVRAMLRSAARRSEEGSSAPAAAFAGYSLYLYDGGHSFADHRNAFMHFDCALAGTFIAVVDDWLQPEWGAGVRGGTRAAFAELGHEVLLEVVLGGGNGGGGGGGSGSGRDREGWWNGLYVAVVRKTRTNCEA